MRRPSVMTSERGSAVVELTWLGILLLVPMIWIVLSVFEVQRGAFGVSAAARSAGRAYALAPDDATGRAAGPGGGGRGTGRPGHRRRLDHPDQLPEPLRDGCHVGGAVIVVHIESHVSLPFLPTFLGDDATFAVKGEHHVPIGQYQDAS